MTTPSSVADAASSKSSQLSFGTKFSYGFGTIGTASTGSMLAFFFMFFMTDVAGLPAAVAGNILVIGQISDAISDPIIGLLSDRTKTRWGRRFPWLIFSAVPFGLSFLLLWLIPTSNPGLLFLYYVVVGMLFKTAYTAVYLPYVSLTPELAKDYNERTRLNSFRFAFSIGSSILALILAGIIFDQVADPALRYVILGGVGCLLCIVPLYVCVFGTWRTVRASENQRDRQTLLPSIPIKEQIQIALRNRPFLIVVGIYLCSWLAAQMTAVVMQYFVVSWMGLSSSVFTTFALTVQGTALSMLFVWSAVSQRVGKKAVYFMGMGLWLIAQLGLFMLQPGQIVLMYVLGFMAGFGVSTAYLIPWSMLPDVIELDELETGHRREGVFYAFMVMMQKVGLAAGLFLVGQALSAAGYIERSGGDVVQAQPESALMVIRLAIGPIPAIILGLGLLLAYFYPISREVHASIVMKLHQQRQDDADDAAVLNADSSAEFSNETKNETKNETQSDVSDAGQGLPDADPVKDDAPDHQ
ncbi:MAG: MFS transporter [Elainellaceae cyanobacterium]